jgi:hypothetical protein
VNDPATEDLIKWSDSGDSFYGTCFYFYGEELWRGGCMLLCGYDPFLASLGGAPAPLRSPQAMRNGPTTSNASISRVTLIFALVGAIGADTLVAMNESCE